MQVGKISNNVSFKSKVKICKHEIYRPLSSKENDVLQEAKKVLTDNGNNDTVYLNPNTGGSATLLSLGLSLSSGVNSRGCHALTVKNCDVESILECYKTAREYCLTETIKLNEGEIESLEKKLLAKKNAFDQFKRENNL